MRKGQEPAFPVGFTEVDGSVEVVFGMSTRLYIATKAMQAIISTTSDDGIVESITDIAKEKNIERKEFIAQMAFGYTDALLEQEEK